jgi:DNA primase
MGQATPELNNAPLAFPGEFKPLLNGSPFSGPFLDYLEERGYRKAQIKWLAENYKLQYATRGLYAGRIIIPIYDRYGELLSWTARAINSDIQPRYRTLRMYTESGSPVAKVPANGTLLGLPVLWRAETPRALILVEGPFDALKVTAFGSALGVYATCVFGLNVYPSQLAEIQELSARFGRIYLLIDEDAAFQRLRLLEALRPARVQGLSMPVGSDDPGALSAGQITELALSVL